MTAGTRSTEFWATCAAFAVGLAVAVTGVVTGRDLLVIAGALEQSVAVVGYAVSRGKSKAPRPHLPPVGRI